jgi:hypothetical protein
LGRWGEAYLRERGFHGIAGGGARGTDVGVLMGVYLKALVEEVNGSLDLVVC